MSKNTLVSGICDPTNGSTNRGLTDVEDRITTQTSMIATLIVEMKLLGIKRSLHKLSEKQIKLLQLN